MVAALQGAMVCALSAQTFTALWSFDPFGGSPYATLIQGADGSLYGTTVYGGGDYGGTAFEITTGGTLTTLYSFCSDGLLCLYDGEYPYGGLVLATNGKLYGTTEYGGNNQVNLGENGYGTVFEITPSGTAPAVYSFCGQNTCAGGSNPVATLVQASNGKIYGTANGGGAYSGGVVFEMTPAGAVTTLYSFCAESSCADGAAPWSGLIQGANGMLYGTTPEGGADGFGEVYQISPSGVLKKIVSFCANCSSSGTSYAGVMQAANGNLYGTTYSGGKANAGTVFMTTLDGKLTTLHNFCGQAQCADGSHPFAGLIQATDGNFYGTTSNGGANGLGTIFRLTPQGALSTLHSFAGYPDGGNPYAGLFQATDGNLYGTTTTGGTSGAGTVFRLSLGLAALVQTVPVAAPAGASVTILGTDLTAASSVLFNGMPATFRVVSPTQIAATVPAGAATGPVQVTTPSGGLSSNVVFRVIE
jgi:uncharacterized repeat protein (TIGR03803 family)